MTIMVTYPYDPSGTKDECHLKEEGHVILTNDNTYRVIVPELAPFFKHDLVITHTGSGLELKEGRDYALAYRLLPAKKIAKYDLYGAIVLINPQLKGEFFVSYRSVGGNFVGIRSDVVTYLANALNDPIKTPFDKVIDRPAYFTPPKHEQHYSDFLNKEFTEEALDELVSAIDVAVASADSDAIAYLTSRIQQLDTKLNQYALNAHIVDYNNPHDTTAAQVKALPKNATAVDSFSAFNLTLVELAEYINSRGITQDDVDRYLAKHGDQFYNGQLTLKDNQAVIRSASGTTSIDLSNGNVIVKADKLVEAFADDDIVSANEVMRLEAGANVLQVVSSGTRGRENNKLLYNGYEVIHGATVREKLKEKGPSGMRVVTQDTETVKWQGSSRQNSKLKANVSQVSLATLTKRGTITLSNSVTENSQVKAPTPYVVNQIRKDILTRVVKSTKVNGHPLTANFSLNKGDFYLDRVDNTADKDKPITQPQQDLLDQYIDGSHTHDISKMNLPLATKDTLGVVRLLSEITDPNSYDGSVTPKAIRQYAEHIVDVATFSAGKLPNDVLDVRFWAPGGPVTCTGLTIDFPEDAQLYINRVDYLARGGYTVAGNSINFATEFPNAYLNETFYIYVEVIDDVVKYVAYKEKIANVGPRIHIATVKAGATEILNVSEDLGYSTHLYDDNVDGILDVEPVTSVGMFRELEEHVADPNAHIKDGIIGDTNAVGLDLIKNYPVIDYASSASHSGIAKWDIFTGWNVDAKNYVTTLANTVANGNVEVSNGITLNVPWNTGGNQLMLLRNTGVEMNNPTYVTDEIEDGVRKRKIGYLLKSKYSPSSTSVGSWYGLIGSHVDEVGDVHDVVVVTSTPNSVTEQVGSVKYYRNGIYQSTLATTSAGTWTSNSGHEQLFMIFEYWQTSDGFSYAVDFQHDGVSNRTLDRQRIELVFKADSFDMAQGAEYFSGGARRGNGRVSTNGNLYPNNNVKKAIMSGVIGFGVEPRGASSGDSPSSLNMTVDCIAADEGGQDQKYISAQGVHQSLRDGANLAVVTGSVVNGESPPMLSNCRFVNVFLGINELGFSDSNNPLDGIDFRLCSTLTNETITSSQLDMLSIHRHAYVYAKHKTESEVSGAVPIKVSRCNYMMVGLRDI